MAKHPTCRNLPCRGCLCVARCSQKDYTQLFIECSKISKYVKNHFQMNKVSLVKLGCLHEVLRPKLWLVKSTSKHRRFLDFYSGEAAMKMRT